MVESLEEVRLVTQLRSPAELDEERELLDRAEELEAALEHKRQARASVREGHAAVEAPLHEEVSALQARVASLHDAVDREELQADRVALGVATGAAFSTTLKSTALFIFYLGTILALWGVNADAAAAATVITALGLAAAYLAGRLR